MPAEGVRLAPAVWEAKRTRGLPGVKPPFPAITPAFAPFNVQASVQPSATTVLMVPAVGVRTLPPAVLVLRSKRSRLPFIMKLVKVSTVVEVPREHQRHCVSVLLLKFSFISMRSVQAGVKPVLIHCAPLDEMYSTGWYSAGMPLSVIVPSPSSCET